MLRSRKNQNSSRPLEMSAAVEAMLKFAFIPAEGTAGPERAMEAQPFYFRVQIPPNGRGDPKSSANYTTMITQPVCPSVITAIWNRIACKRVAS